MNTINGKHTHRTTSLSAIVAFFIFVFSFNTAKAQTAIVSTGEHNFEHFGHTFNIGVGPAYFGSSVMRSPFFSFNYEIEVLRNFTVAPFVGFATYRSNEVWVGPTRHYSYRGTIIPVGAKLSYYFDEVIELPWRWDLYAGGSLGYTIRGMRWDAGYPGPVNELPGIKPLFLAAHVGTEYHVSDMTGIFLDISTKVVAVGVGLHM